MSETWHGFECRRCGTIADVRVDTPSRVLESILCPICWPVDYLMTGTGTAGLVGAAALKCRGTWPADRDGFGSRGDRSSRLSPLATDLRSTVARVVADYCANTNACLSMAHFIDHQTGPGAKTPADLVRALVVALRDGIQSCCRKCGALTVTPVSGPCPAERSRCLGSIGRTAAELEQLLARALELWSCDIGCHIPDEFERLRLKLPDTIWPARE